MTAVSSRLHGHPRRYDKINTWIFMRRTVASLVLAPNLVLFLGWEEGQSSSSHELLSFLQRDCVASLPFSSMHLTDLCIIIGSDTSTSVSSPVLQRDILQNISTTYQRQHDRWVGIRGTFVVSDLHATRVAQTNGGRTRSRAKRINCSYSAFNPNSPDTEQRTKNHGRQTTAVFQHNTHDPTHRVHTCRALSSPDKVKLEVWIRAMGSRACEVVEGRLEVLGSRLSG